MNQKFTNSRFQMTKTCWLPNQERSAPARTQAGMLTWTTTAANKSITAIITALTPQVVEQDRWNRLIWYTKQIWYRFNTSNLAMLNSNSLVAWLLRYWIYIIVHAPVMLLKLIIIRNTKDNIEYQHRHFTTYRADWRTCLQK
jgi:hypothetical protein